MIDLNDENDPLLFCVTLPCGKLIFQFAEVGIAIQEETAAGATPTTASIAAAIRKVARTKDTAEAATPEQIVAAFSRASDAVERAGKG
jgi:hypothetical protein